MLTSLISNMNYFNSWKFDQQFTKIGENILILCKHGQNTTEKQTISLLLTNISMNPN